MRQKTLNLHLKQSKNNFFEITQIKNSNHMSRTKTMPKYFDNPIKVLHHLEAAGFTKKQAEAQVEVFTDYIDHNLVTKKDLANEVSILRAELKEMELRLTIKTAAIVGSIVGFFSLMEKFL